jgi:hypothetical protein
VLRARVFIDFWNFQLGWNDATGPGVQCDWKLLPRTLVGATEGLLATTGSNVSVTLEETLVHASVNEAREKPLHNWLTNFLDQQPSFDVKVRTRRPRAKKVYCRSCQTETSECSSCGEPFISNGEKGVDAALVTDLLSLAWQRAYDVAILVSGDADYVPAVEYVQSQGLKVINAVWASKGHDLRNACWGSFRLDDHIGQLTR